LNGRLLVGRCSKSGASTATLLPDGTVLIAGSQLPGGFADRSFLSLSELMRNYDFERALASAESFVLFYFGFSLAFIRYSFAGRMLLFVISDGRRAYRIYGRPGGGTSKHEIDIGATGLSFRKESK
jgi:hypothetical protein